MFLRFPARFSAYNMRLCICEPVHALKKRAKVQLFFDMTKYF